MKELYTHTRLDTNEIFYVGIGQKGRSKSKKRSKWWKKIASKTDYRIDILFTNLTQQQACEKEIELIKLYGRRDLGLGTLVNMTGGGEGLTSPSQETRNKIGAALRGKPLSEDHKNKIRQGIDRTKIGLRQSANTQQKIYDAIEVLQMRPGKITQNNVAAEVGMSKMTVKRYWSEFKEYVKEINDKKNASA